jgi:hypothetical protein
MPAAAVSPIPDVVGWWRSGYGFSTVNRRLPHRTHAHAFARTRARARGDIRTDVVGWIGSPGVFCSLLTRGNALGWSGQPVDWFAQGPHRTGGSLIVGADRDAG